MPSAIETQIKERITEFVAELDTLIRKSTLETLQGVLGGNATPARRGRPAGSGRGPGRPRATVGGNSVEAVLSFVRSNDGQGVREISAGTGVSTAIAKKVVAQLLDSGALKKSGQRRGTKYHIGSGKPARGSKAKAKRKPAKRTKRRGKKAKAA